MSTIRISRSFAVQPARAPEARAETRAAPQVAEPIDSFMVGAVDDLDPANGLDQFVVEAYRTHLRREPDYEGYRGWVEGAKAKLAEGFPRDEVLAWVERGFVESPERAALSLVDEKFLHYLQRDVSLGRGDHHEWATQQMRDQGRSAEEVGAELSDILTGSNEYALFHVSQTVNEAFEELLGRPAGEEGYWHDRVTERLHAGESPQDVRAWLRASIRESEEYKARHPAPVGPPEPPQHSAIRDQAVARAHEVGAEINNTGGYRFDGVNDCYGFMRRVWDPVLRANGMRPLPVNDAPSANWARIDWDALKPGDVLATHAGHAWGAQWHGGLYAGKIDGVHYIHDNSGELSAKLRPLPSTEYFRYVYTPVTQL